MKSFETKKALLEYLGKNPDDRRLVDRMMARWSVRHFDGMYYLMEEEDVDALVGKILEPRKVEVMADKVSDETIAKLEEAKVNAEYWEKECRRYWRLINNVISVCYRKLKGLLGSRFTMSEEEFREWVIEEVKMWEE